MVSGQPQEKAKSSRARTSYTPLFGLNDHARDPLKGMVFRVLRLKTGYMILLFGVSDVLKEYESWRWEVYICGTNIFFSKTNLIPWCKFKQLMRFVRETKWSFGWILKFKTQLKIAFFAAVNHLNGTLRRKNFTLTGSKGQGLWFVIGGFRSISCVSVFQGSLLVIVIMIDGCEKRNCEGGFWTLEFVCLWKAQ